MNSWRKGGPLKKRALKEGKETTLKKDPGGRGPLLKRLRRRVLMEESKKPWAEEESYLVRVQPRSSCSLGRVNSFC